MDSSNWWYGHAHILARWCGRDPELPPRINGVIQHGWTFVHGFGYGHNPPEGFAKYAWSDVCRERGQAIGWRDYVVIGAPFMYLLEMDEEQPERRGTIWYPFHGTPDFEKMHGDHRGLIETIREVEGDEPVTVCLYHVEYDQPDVRATYEDAGFRVICHGQRGRMYSGGNTDFLSGQLAELKRHKRVASNRLSTAVFYGLAAGCDAGVYGDPMQLDDVKEGFNGTGLLEATFPELHGERLDLDRAWATALRELGADHITAPDELALLLGWKDED